MIAVAINRPSSRTRGKPPVIRREHLMEACTALNIHILEMKKHLAQAPDKGADGVWQKHIKSAQDAYNALMNYSLQVHP